MLTTDVQTASDLMSIALRAEHEAIQRYIRLAETMRINGNQEVASLFERLVKEEQEHKRLIEEWAHLEAIQLRTDIGSVDWKDPQVLTDYDNEATDPAHSTPYRALAFAVHNEERAFHFYTQVAATANSETVRDYAETLAREELGHAALLRSMRRRAWHAERDVSHDEPDIEPSSINTLADLLTVAASAERCLAEHLAAIVHTYPELNRIGAAMQRTIADTETRLRSAGNPGVDATKAVESIENYKNKIASTNDDSDVTLQRLCSNSDRCFAFYDAVVSQTRNEDVMLTAQQLSESALKRVELLSHNRTG